MGCLKVTVLLLLPITLGILFSCCFLVNKGKLPENGDGWWAVTDEKEAGGKVKEDIVPLKIKFSNETLSDLKKRLQNTRYFESLQDSNFEYGFNTKYLKEVVAYWKDKYDWRAQEAKLNAYPHFTTMIEGIKIHFIHVKASAKIAGKSRPLLMMHGWPGSIWEFHKIIPLLAGSDSGVQFELIIPSIPGYGFSEAPHRPGFDVIDAGRIFYKLMKRLGHDKFYVQGGDWGAIIAKVMSQLYDEDILGLHVNFAAPATLDIRMIPQQLLAMVFPSLVFTPEELAAGVSLKGEVISLLRESGYMHIQATRPDTVGVGLTDSPTGLAAYILEKFSVWSNLDNRFCPDGCLSKHFTIDELLTNVMIYWLNGNVASSMRFYKESFTSEEIRNMANVPVNVSTGVAIFPHEITTYFKAEAFVRLQYPNLVHFTRLPRGGHFAAMEQPQLLADDVISFVKVVEKLK